MSITIRRLAQLAGVSHVTVLRALHGRDAVSAKTRLRVVELARKYHFPLPPSRATETPNLMNSLCSMVDIRNDEPQSDQGFNHRLLAGLTQGAAACGAAGRRRPTSREAPFHKLTVIGAGAKQSAARASRRRPRPRIVKSRTRTRTTPDTRHPTPDTWDPRPVPNPLRRTDAMTR